jgi:putative membrane protein
MMLWNHGGWGLGDWLMMSLFMVAFWGLIIGFVVWLVRGSGNDRTPLSGGRPTKSASPDNILAERFARGEIEEDEFTRRREMLHTTGGVTNSAGGA